MKKKSILDKQLVKRKSHRDFSRLWGVLRRITSLSFKLSLLLVGMVCVSLLFLYLYQYLITSPYIKLEKVIVTGVDKGMRDELIEMSELNADLSLLTINLNEVKTIMEGHPWVRSVGLEKRFPNTLVVRVEKEVPRALVALDKLAYMNRQGKIFKEVHRSDNKDFPVITGISESPGTRERQLKLAASVLDLFQSETGAWALEQISEIHVKSDGDILLYSISLPAVINLGQRELDVKKGELKKIVNHLKKTGRIHTVKVIDLNYMDGAVVSFRKS